MDKFGLVEPAAEWRNAAKQVYEMYVAFIQSGFTEQQALELVKQLVKNQPGGR